MLVLRNARLIDGTGREAVTDASVVIEGDRIEYAGTDPQYGEAARVIDLNGLVLMPGLIDLHVHCGDQLANIGDTKNIRLGLVGGRVVLDKIDASPKN